jgi:hypothetical protein
VDANDFGFYRGRCEEFLVVQVPDESLAAFELQENGMAAKWSTVASL